jgi:serine protease AprX
MPHADRTPIDRQPEPFDPKNLRRSVIAVPLREAIEQELDATKQFAEKHAELLKGHSAAVFFLGDNPQEIAAARQRVLKRLEKAVQELREIKVLPEDSEPQSIDTLLPELENRASLASLRGRVIGLLLAMDAASDPITDDGKPAPPAIDHIWPTRFEVIIDINLNFNPPESAAHIEQEGLEQPDARQIAKKWIAKYIDEAKQKTQIADPDQGVDKEKTRLSAQYVFARLEGKVIQELVAIDQRAAKRLAKEETKAAARREKKSLQGAGKSGVPEPRRAQAITPAEAKRRAAEKLAAEEKRLTARFRTIHHIWPDFRLRSCITQSISTVKADAAHRSFTASGKGITWAVMDSGIDGTHPHFRLHNTVDLASTYHKDFTGLATTGSALRDEYGHGTHVSGIIAGEQSLAKGAKTSEMVCVWRELDEVDAGQGEASGGDEPQATTKQMTVEAISGIAPQCQLISLKVLDRFGMGNASNAITAIAHVQEVNHHGRELHIHGVNLSLGYPFDPKWFACGHSPLCVEVNRLVRSGVVVVVAAGNSGYGTLVMKDGKTTDACLDLTINDPGNAECAITVGSTHRDMPYMYGVSYFSSKGPTGDGRCKPDLLAPGEKIISCAAPKCKLVKDEADNKECNYFETSGTSMAAPHVSGAIAAFLSIRKEFIGEPERVKKIFTSTATDLGRDRYFQGSGLVDLMRAIQSV